ncbi:Ca(2+)/H(+) antiporter [Candidatus Entotheonellaceae bacterium PAL068K]
MSPAQEEKNGVEQIAKLPKLSGLLIAIIQASVVGSTLGNLLLVLGAAMLYGGTKYQVQWFSLTGASMNVGRLSLLFSLRTHRFLLMPGAEEHEEAEWSRPMAIVMLLGSTLIVAYLSEGLMGSIGELVRSGAIAIPCGPRLRRQPLPATVGSSIQGEFQAGYRADVGQLIRM